MLHEKLEQALQHTRRVCTCMRNACLCTHSLASSTNSWHLLLRNHTWHTFHNRIFLQLLPVSLSSLSPSTSWGGCPSRCQLLFHLNPIHTLCAASWEGTVPTFCFLFSIFLPIGQLVYCDYFWPVIKMNQESCMYRQLDLHLKLACLTVLYSRNDDLAITKASQHLSSE